MINQMGWPYDSVGCLFYSPPILFSSYPILLLTSSLPLLGPAKIIRCLVMNRKTHSCQEYLGLRCMYDSRPPPHPLLLRSQGILLPPAATLAPLLGPSHPQGSPAGISYSEIYPKFRG